MALLNPVYAFIVPFLFIVTVPLALLAGITTTLAFAVLIFRVVIVYLDVALSLVPQVLASARLGRPHVHDEARLPLQLALSNAASINGDGPLSASLLHQQQQQQQQQQPLLQRRRRRRPSSTVSILSTGGTTTPVGDLGLGLMPSVGADRDFEGLGGWRSGDDDAVWTAINSRMELPVDRGFIRHHHRSQSSGGATTPGDHGVLMMKAGRRSPDARIPAFGTSSPNTSRARTPSASRPQSLAIFGNLEGYFPSVLSPKSNKK